MMDRNATAAATSAGLTFVAFSLLVPLWCLLWGLSLAAAAEAAASDLPVHEGPWDWLAAKLGMRSGSGAYGPIGGGGRDVVGRGFSLVPLSASTGDAAPAGDDHGDAEGTSPPRSVTFHCLSCFVTHRKNGWRSPAERLAILQEVSGAIDPGQLTAIMVHFAACASDSSPPPPSCGGCVGQEKQQQSSSATVSL